LLNVLGEVAEGLPGWDDGDPDVPARIVAGSLAPVPWSRRPMAQALFRMYENDDTPYFADPRAVLERAIAPLQKMRLTARAAVAPAGRPTVGRGVTWQTSAARRIESVDRETVAADRSRADKSRADRR
jgi:hypothetical protein